MQSRLAIGGLGIVVLMAALVAQQQPAPQMPSRPGQGRQPEWPAPAITEYKPRPMLVVPEHPTPRAKFPAIDVHSHLPTPISPEQFDKVVVITAPAKLRETRRGGRTDDRESRLLPDREKAKRADFTYVNTGTPEELDAWVAGVMATLSAEHPTPSTSENART